MPKRIVKLRTSETAADIGAEERIEYALESAEVDNSTSPELTRASNLPTLLRKGD
jgi:hypothetical protein